ncbi:MAG: RCC1 domain-containing protein [Persicimonas sp.]
MKVERWWIAAVLIVLGLTACQTELELTDRTFRCQTSADCADGYRCVPVPGEQRTRVCKQPGEGFPSRDAGDEADTDTSGPAGDADANIEHDTSDVETDPDVRPHADNELVVTSGQDFSCAFTAAGEAYCWGRNQEGQLGTGGSPEDNAWTPVPVQMPGTTFISTPATVDSKHRLTCAIGVDRAVYCWGRNNGGSANPATLDPVVSPTRVEFPDDSLRFAQVVVGYDHACALSRDSELYCWGSNLRGQQGVGRSGEGEMGKPPERVDESGFEHEVEHFIEVAAGLEFTCASTNADRVYCWGLDDFGRLANGESDQDADTPRKIESGDWTGEPVVDLTAYAETACMLVHDGDAYCWGRNADGQVGAGSTEETSHVEPSLVVGDFSFEGLYSGELHTCAITDAGRAVCWGANDNSQLGLEGAEGDSVLQPGEPIRPTAFNEELPFRHLAPGVAHTCGVTDERDPRVFCWGDNTVGQLGNDSVSEDTAVPHLVELP